MAQAPPIGQDVTALMGGGAPGDSPSVGQDVTHLMGVPNFKQSDTSPNEIDPNTVGTLLRHVWNGINPVQLGQLLPFPKTLGGSGMDNPLLPSNIAKRMQAVKLEGDAAWNKGDKVTARTKYVESLIPLFGPLLSHMGDDAQAGKYMAVAGDTAALAANTALGKVGGGASEVGQADAANETAAFAKARGIPLDAATVSDNLAVKGAQALADRSLGGSIVATPANAARAEAMSRVGGDLAAETGAAATTPEQAGTTLRQALTQKVAGHSSAADAAYDTLRELEQQPTNRMAMPTKPQAVDALAEGQTGQLRRIVHELDASGYVKGKSIDANPGVDSSSYYSPGSAGAKVFDDIVARMGGTSTPTRGVVQNQLETYLGGGPETNIVKAAIDVAQARSRAQGGGAVSVPELPASAMSVPTRLEASRVTSEDMGFPVSLLEPKAALRPLYEQMKRQMPITQQQANPGLKAIENILTGPDYGPLSQIDRDLSAIKTVARQHGGLAKMAVSKLEAAVSEAAQNGGPEVVSALQKGRQATISKYAATDVLESLNDEPVKTVRALTAPKDAGIQQLRTIAQQVPQQTPEIARAYLEDVLEKPNKVAEWNKLGSQTKAILFPKAGQSQALDNFFALTKRISDTNVNPSGSGYVAALGAQGAMLWYDPVHAGAVQISGAALSKLLRSPAAINALTRGLTLPASAPATVRAAATANLIRAAQSSGVVLDFPKAAQASPGSRP